MFALSFVIIKFYKIKHKIFSITIERTITFNVSFPTIQKHSNISHSISNSKESLKKSNIKILSSPRRDGNNFN